MGGETRAVDDPTGPRALVVPTVLLALALLCFSARIYTRIFPSYKLHASDFMNSFAIFMEIIAYSLFAASINIGYGRHASFIAPKQRIKILQLLLAIRTAGLCAATFARLSTAYQLIKLKPSVAWKRSLWVMVGFLITSFLVVSLFKVLQCRPVSAIWDKTTPNSRCLGSREVWIISNVQAGVGIVSDLAFAIMPMLLIWKLSRSVLERCLVSILLALGLCATGMGIAILVRLNAKTMLTDPLQDSVTLSMYCRVEETCLLIACSLIFLKAPVEYLLRQVGAPGFHNIPGELASYNSNGGLDLHELGPSKSWGLGRPENEHSVQLERHLNTLTKPHSFDFEGGFDNSKASKDSLPPAKLRARIGEERL
ncbi:hypothetical protein GQ44DRAFT_673047 [Phaeosphaeriaceae sp. PMI808]|nr:hypothetical protein GQ44DRAFT_673047 [Phaeosphaeriaceae sp. PMI808]